MCTLAMVVAPISGSGAEQSEPKSAIDGVAALHSVRAWERLVPLAVVLEASPGSDHREPDWMAWQVATLRPA